MSSQRTRERRRDARQSNLFRCVTTSDALLLLVFRLLCKCEKNCFRCKVCNWVIADLPSINPIQYVRR